MTPEFFINIQIGRYSFLTIVLIILPVILAGECSTDSSLKEGPVSYKTLRVIYPIWTDKESVHSCDFNQSNIEFDSTGSETGPGDIELLITNKRNLINSSLV